MADTELLPCPFCGGPGRYLPHKEGFWSERVICDKCEVFVWPHTWQARKALASRPAEVDDKPVAYAVVSKKGGIHKLCITRPSAERKAAVWQEEWPDNGCTVRPLVFGDSAPSHTTNMEK